MSELKDFFFQLNSFDGKKDLMIRGLLIWQFKRINVIHHNKLDIQLLEIEFSFLHIPEIIIHFSENIFFV